MVSKQGKRAPEMKNIGVGHLIQSIKAQYALLDSMRARVEKTEAIAEYLSALGQLEAPQVKADRTKEYFIKCLDACRYKGKELETYEDFQQMTSSMEMMEVFLERAEKWTGKKMTYPEADQLAMEVLPTETKKD